MGGGDGGLYTGSFAGSGLVGLMVTIGGTSGRSGTLGGRKGVMSAVGDFSCSDL